MRKIIEFIKINRFSIIGGIIGGAGGYLYWYKIGCTTGTCPITSSPIMSTLWGVLLGVLFFRMIFPGNIRPKSELKEIINKGALLLDVRTRSEYLSGHIKDSMNIPLDELDESLQLLDKNQIIIVVCASGMRSSKAVSLMKQNGFTNCCNGGSWVNFNN